MKDSLILKLITIKIQSNFFLGYYQNLRVGFACDGECSGGGWHGTGGIYDRQNQ